MKSDKNVKATLSTKKKGCCRALVAAQLVNSKTRDPSLNPVHEKINCQLNRKKRKRKRVWKAPILKQNSKSGKNYNKRNNLS